MKDWGRIFNKAKKRVKGCVGWNGGGGGRNQ